jgi:uncharacterized membrane protein YeaQ/YmgE (transglycosylase-associated protein family)
VTRGHVIGLITYLIVTAAGGLLVGALARRALPGPDPVTLFETMLVGLGGLFAAGLVARLLFGSPAAGIVLSVLAASAIVYGIGGHREGEPVRVFGSHR